MSTEDALREKIADAMCAAGDDTFGSLADAAIEALGIPLPVLAWCSANPEAAKGLAEAARVAVPKGHLDGLQRHYRQNPPRGSRESVDVRDLVAALDLPYVPAVIDYAGSGESEFVLFDTLTIAHDGPGYIILKDETGAVIGFRWRTASPPARDDKAQGHEPTMTNVDISDVD